MATQVGSHTQGRVSAAAGSVTLALGILSVLAVAFLFVLSLSQTFNPPNWIRVAGLVWLPITFGGVPVVYYTLARVGEGRTRGRLGVLLTLASLAAFIGLITALG